MRDLTTPPFGPAGADSGGALLRLAGADALDLLHRLSTQSLSDLPPGGARMALFCDFRGRLLHRACVARTADSVTWLLRDDAGAEELIAFLDRHVFREDVVLEDASAGHRVRLVPLAQGLPVETVEEVHGVPRRARPDSEFVYEVLEKREDSSPDPEAERARIRAGLPRHGHEIAEAFTPFEVGRGHEVHLNKGCFTGQEALMRLVTFRSVRRQLVRVSGRGAPPAPPEPIASAGAGVGVVTSAIGAADGNAWLGLAVVKREALAAPLTLADGRTISVEPIPATRPQGLPDGLG